MRVIYISLSGRFTKENEMNAAQVKKVLKEAGINTKAIRVSVRPSAMDVRILDAKVSKAEIEKVLAQFESVNKCEMTGEYLSGGNFFVFVEYACENPKDAVEAALTLNWVWQDRDSTVNKIYHLKNDLAEKTGYDSSICHQVINYMAYNHAEFRAKNAIV